MEKISVAVRFQPPNPIPTPAGASSTSDGGDREWRIKDAHVSLLHCTFFAFDHVFDAAATNARVIRAAVDGCNGTVFAYGQTSSGKTHTMSGSGADPGVIPLAVRDLFDTASQAVDREFCFKVPYMEIYNEDINDLLTLGSEKLQIRDNLKHEACVGGLREDVVESAEETLGIVNLGEAKRHFGQINMNVQSSRSHTIFRMIIESRAKNKMDSGDAIRVSVLNLVDLAGSERTSKTGAEGVRLKEGKFINKSLMNLGIVINKLSENGKKMGHIPYRHSKLTRILEPALGGNAKTSIICTAAPEEIHIDETKGTLQFASRAKCVSNCAQVNEILTDAVLIERQKQKIQELRKRLQGSDSEAMKQVVVKQCNGIRKYKLELDGLTMELEQERKSWEEERILRETLEHQLTMENKTIEDLKKTSTSSDQFTSSIEAAPADEEQDCSSVRRQALETELELLRKENSLLLQELSSSKEEAGCAAAKMQELEARCQKLENDRVADREEAEEECNLLKEETSCLLLELSRCKQEAGRLAAEKQAQLDELMARCAALREEKTFLAQELELSRCAAREAGNLAAEKLAALEEALSASGREAEHLAAENRVPAEELGAEKRRRSAEAADWEVPLNADDSV